MYFIESGHSYKSHPDEIQIDWVSATAIVELFSDHFDTKKKAYECSIGQSKTKKYIGLSVTQILELWDRENKRATESGSRYHLQKERAILNNHVQFREGLALPVYPPIMHGDKKIAGPQKLTPGVYPEHLMYLNSAGVCGQTDRIEVTNSFIDVYDHKTNKRLEFEGYRNPATRIVKKMKSILKHLDDCNYIHYSIQLSIYMYILRKHNYLLKPRRLVLEHVTFALKESDQYGFPIYERDMFGNPIVNDVVNYHVDYLEREVIAIFNFIKENPNFIRDYKLQKKKNEIGY